MTNWWTEEEIQARVDRRFVTSKLRPEEQALLNRRPAFGDGLTDDTYIEWILEKARKLFLILVEIGVPDQVFGVIDASFDDDDLPLSVDAVSQLKLSAQRDDNLNKRFYSTQFHYLVRHLNHAEHIQYNVDEVVPLELVKRKAEVIQNHHCERVLLPGRPGKVFARRKFFIGSAAGNLPEEKFIAEVNTLKAISHDHIMSLWASYTQDHSGYIILAPAPDLTLKSFLSDNPPHFKTLPKPRRREILLNWPHCLADALAFLHWNGYAHQDIRPSNIFVDPSNSIFLGDIASAKLKTPQGRKKSGDNEPYEYAAPEQWVRTAVLQQTAPTRSAHTGGGRSGRKMSTTDNTTSPKRMSYFSDVSSLSSYDTGSPSITETTTTASSSSSGSTAIVQKFRSKPTDPQRSDIFSLACIFVEILTLLMKRKISSFASHRSSKNRSAGRGGAPADASFHVNLSQVAAWIDILDGDAFKKDDQLFRGVPPMLAVIVRMLSREPRLRPSAVQVEEKLDDALFRYAHVQKPHCGTKHFAEGTAATVESKMGSALAYTSKFENGGYTFDAQYDIGKVNLLSMPMPMRPSSKESKSSETTVRTTTLPLRGEEYVGTKDGFLGAFMGRA